MRLRPMTLPPDPPALGEERERRRGARRGGAAPAPAAARRPTRTCSSCPRRSTGWRTPRATARWRRCSPRTRRPSSWSPPRRRPRRTSRPRRRAPRGGAVRRRGPPAAHLHERRLEPGVRGVRPPPRAPSAPGVGAARALARASVAVLDPTVAGHADGLLLAAQEHAPVVSRRSGVVDALAGRGQALVADDDAAFGRAALRLATQRDLRRTAVAAARANADALFGGDAGGDADDLRAFLAAAAGRHPRAMRRARRPRCAAARGAGRRGGRRGSSCGGVDPTSAAPSRRRPAGAAAAPGEGPPVMNRFKRPRESRSASSAPSGAYLQRTLAPSVPSSQVQNPC